MSTTIEHVRDDDGLTELIAFADRVYADRPVRWPAMPGLVLPVLNGTGPGATGRELRPLVARRDGEIVARVVAVVDHRYIEHWKEQVGHVVLFEALPDTRDAVRVLMDAACSWLRERGMHAARAGFGMQDFPFVIDDYDSLPPVIARHNPPFVHALLKDAGFESEQGWVDYKIRVTPELVERYESAVEAVRRSGYELVPLGEADPSTRVAQFTELWNRSFRSHWGYTPFSREEIAELCDFLGPFGMYDTSVIAYKDGEPAGVLWVTPEGTALAVAAPGREIREDEKLNFLGIGVDDAHRGRGVNTAMAGFSYLRLIAAGATYLSYTLVLDDNWPSRRTGEKLGGEVCANYLVYRRNLGVRRA